MHIKMAFHATGRPFFVSLVQINLMKLNYTCSFFVFFIAQFLASQNLVLDPTFGTNGKVTTVIAVDNDTHLKSLAIQSNGKIIACGRNADYQINSLMLLRYNEDGSLDNTFGTNGIALSTLVGGEGSLYVRMLDNDKILVTGNRLDSNNTNKPFISVFNSNGSPDITVGNNGTHIYSGFPGKIIISSVNLDSSGRIVLCGTTLNVVSGIKDVFVARFLDDYTIDTSFGTNGCLIFNCGVLSNLNSTATDLVLKILTDGSLLIAGSSDLIAGNSSDFFLSKFNANGAVDTSFGNQGRVITDFGLKDIVATMDVLPDGKIVLTGNKLPLNLLTLPISIISSKYNTDGSLDMNYGVSGKMAITFDSPNGQGQTLRVLCVSSQMLNGNLILSGDVYFGNDIYIMLTSINPQNGTLNTSFGNNGFVVHDFGPNDPGYNDNMTEVTRASLLQNDGKIVIGGALQQFYGYMHITLLRYQDASLNTTETASPEVKIYPNPFQNQITIEGYDSSQSLMEMYDVIGRKLNTSVLQNDSNIIISINENLSKGNYLLRITTDQKSKTFKIIKQ